MAAALGEFSLTLIIIASASWGEVLDFAAHIVDLVLFLPIHCSGSPGYSIPGSFMLVCAPKKGQELRILAFRTQLMHCLTFLFGGFLLKPQAGSYFTLVTRYSPTIFAEATAAGMLTMLQNRSGSAQLITSEWVAEKIGHLRRSL